MLSSSRKTPSAKPFAISQIRLTGGIFKDRQDVHEHYLMMIEPDRMVAPFRLQAGLSAKAERYGGWESRDISGHTLGHYLSALCFLYASRGDEAVRSRINYIVDELDLCQKANGDGYVLPVEKKAFQALREGTINASPFALNGVWVPFYTLHKVLAGLRDGYRLVRNANALEIECKVIDWLHGILSQLNGEQIQLMLRTEHGGMNEVLAALSEDTGNDIYLEMAAKYFHHQTVLAPMFGGEDKLNGLHGNTQIPKVVGLACEYELNGLAEYRVAAEMFWDTIVNRRSYAIGGHGESEHFFPLEQFPKRLTPNTCETCNTYNMLKLTGHLFSWEPKAAQMDFVERAMINHLAANIGRQPGEFGYFLGLGSVGVKVFSTPFDSWWCCVGTGLENPARYGEHIYFHNGGTLWVNLYAESTLSWPEKSLELRQETRFPEDETVRIVFNCESPTNIPLKLRHPYWCQDLEVKINGAPISIKSLPSSYLTLERTWQSGDVIELALPMRLRLEALPHSNDKVLAVMYGPTVLAAVIPDTPGVINPAKQRFSEHLNARGKTDAFPPFFVAASGNDVLDHLKPTGNSCEFRSEGIIKPDDFTFMPLYRIYEEQYAVYFPLLSNEEWIGKESEFRAAHEALRRMEAATLDSVSPGFQQSEVEHSLRSEYSEIEDFADRKCRSAKDGGWFSYDMAVDPVEPALLIVTYWGGVWHRRVFDLLIDGQKLATQSLLTNKPGDFFDENYPISTELTQGKTKITVRFQSRPGDIAGGVFRISLMNARLSVPHRQIIK